MGKIHDMHRLGLFTFQSEHQHQQGSVFLGIDCEKVVWNEALDLVSTSGLKADGHHWMVIDKQVEVS